LRRFVLRRILLAVLVLWGVASIVFVLTRTLPGDPVALWVGPKPSNAQLVQARHELGLDRPLPVQYVSYLREVAKGNLGFSLWTKRPVTEELGRRFSATFELVTLSMFATLVLGLWLGVLCAKKPDGALDRIVRLVALGGAAFPLFLFAMLLQMFFYGKLGWLPLQGRQGPEAVHHTTITGMKLVDLVLARDFGGWADAAKHIAMPALALTFALLAIVTRIVRSTMLEVLNADYIRTARAYGIGERTINYRFALKNTLITLLTVIGLTYGYALGGSFIVELIFDWPGLGGYAVSAIENNDYPSVMGVTMVYATTFVALNLVIDLLYHVIDPRLRIAPPAAAAPAAA
jgi:peptide/nickel transport system permease protein